MSLQDRLKQLDDLVSQGKLEEAVEQFYHPNVVCYSNLSDVTIGKEEKLVSIREFRNAVALVNHIGLRNQTIGGNVTMSEFMIDIAYKFGKRVVREEIIKRVWLDGMIMEERYYTLDPAPPLHPVNKSGLSYQFLTKEPVESGTVEVVNEGDAADAKSNEINADDAIQVEEVQEMPMSAVNDAPTPETLEEVPNDDNLDADEEQTPIDEAHDALNTEGTEEESAPVHEIQDNEPSAEQEEAVDEEEHNDKPEEEEERPVLSRGVLTTPVFQQPEAEEEEEAVMSRGVSVQEEEEEDEDLVFSRGVMSTPVFREAPSDESESNSDDQEEESESEEAPVIMSRSVNAPPAEEKTLARTVKPNVELPEVTPEPVASTIHFDKSGQVESIELLLDLNHTYIGDLTISLISPEGTVAVIHNEEGGSRNKIKRTYSGDIFAEMHGEEIHGDWTLEISDTSPRDAGWLNLWGLIIDLED
jgi:subtilisin-like proprotein convertase family protein